MKKPTVILTNRNFIDKEAWEKIELQENGVFAWRAYEDGVECYFPVSMSFVKEKFIECGKEFDESRLPPTAFKGCPYTEWRAA